MTWNDVRIFTLQKMFELQGDSFSINDEAAQAYVPSMPHVANEGLMRLATVGRFLLRPFAIAQGIADPAADIVRDLGQGWSRYDFMTLAEDFYSFDEREIYYEGGGLDKRTSNFRIEGEGVLALPAAMQGRWQIYYRAYPGEITKDTDPAKVMALHPEMAVLLPLYMASQLYKDDDISLATTWRNEFEAALTSLVEGQRRKGLGREEIENTTGWW